MNTAGTASCTTFFCPWNYVKYRMLFSKASAKVVLFSDMTKSFRGKLKENLKFLICVDIYQYQKSHEKHPKTLKIKIMFILLVNSQKSSNFASTLFIYTYTKLLD